MLSQNLIYQPWFQHDRHGKSACATDVDGGASSEYARSSYVMQRGLVYVLPVPTVRIIDTNDLIPFPFKASNAVGQRLLEVVSSYSERDFTIKPHGNDGVECA